MAEIILYRVWCIEDAKYVFVWLDSTAPAPTECPENSEHSIDTDISTVIDRRVVQDEVFLGNALNYNSVAKPEQNEVQYVQVTLDDAVDYDRVRLFIDDPKQGATIRAKVFDDSAGAPGSSLSEGSLAFTSEQAPGNLIVTLDQSLSGTGQKVWVAVQVDDHKPRFLATLGSHGQEALVLFEDAGSPGIPDNPNPDTTKRASIFLAALKRV